MGEVVGIRMGEEEFESCLRELWRAVYGPLYRKMRARAGAAGLRGPAYAEAVEEAVMTAFAELWAEPAGYDPTRAKLVVWLRMRARDALRPDIRAAERWRKGLEAVEARGRGGEADTSEPDRVATRLWVSGAMAGLGPDQAQALRLHYCEERTLDEVAEETGLSSEAASSRIRRARRDLEDRLAGRPPRKRGRPPKKKGGEP